MRSLCSWILASVTFAATLALGGCSTTKMIVNDWSNPAYKNFSFGRIMAGAATEQSSIRRNLEDEFVSQLRQSGVEGLPSYRYIPEDEKVDETKLKQAAQKAGADGAILARAINVEQRTEYGPSYYPVPSFGFFGPHFGTTWYGPFGAPTVHRYQVYTSEVTLYDVRKNAVVWTATLKTTDPDNVSGAIKSYVAEVVKTLDEKDLLGMRH